MDVNILPHIERIRKIKDNVCFSDVRKMKKTHFHMEKIIEKTEHILDHPGLKILLLDPRTNLIGSLIPQSRFLDNNFFLFDNITNTKRTEFEVHCVLIISLDYLKYLICEITSPKYLSYTIYFVNKIDSNLLKEIASSDIYGKIINVFELNYNLIKEDSNLFIFKEKDLFKKAEALQSLLETLEISPQTVKLHSNETELNLLSNSINEQTLKRGTLFLFEREIDMITPLLYPWRYQELIKQYFNYKNQLITLGATINPLDEFFEKNKFEDIFSVSQNLKADLKKVQTGKNEFDKKILEFHLKLVNEIIKKAVKNSKLSEIEMNIIKNKINKTISAEHIDEFKNELIYFYRTGKIENLKYREVINKFVKQYPMKKLSRTFSKYISFKKYIDVKLSYRGRIYKILKNFLNGSLSSKFVFENKNSTKYPLIIFMNGPLSYGEYYQICSLFLENNVSLNDIFIVCEEIWTYEDFLNPYLNDIC